MQPGSIVSLFVLLISSEAKYSLSPGQALVSKSPKTFGFSITIFGLLDQFGACGLLCCLDRVK
jgi:hypothetical protein